MDNLLYISALIAAIAFAVLVVYLVRLLKESERTMTSVANTLEGLEKQMVGITTETTLLLNRTNALAEDINLKADKLNVLVDSISGLSTTFTTFSASVKEVSDTISRIAVDNKEETAQVIKWGNVAMEVLKKKKDKRTTK
ncbi:hypothetical protein GCM10012290_18390 [Halolactibacillus alkaliphilus]|uniref:General stress protein n=1 Tax=Halolactibacillus alkaliphilus TaxID=442899 RepID=A0A511X2X2_9BACI|nr:DUF948 domain-containing protein [Halolactibacillus alkaliphilus]GEN57293.1 hypothetical protein HAL01_17570 [Halolactibacillus alkaliphilus]GGN72427.1 hypothetical protein GCM10012290_18390 [Halolactibacillus alkaliphilus]SFO89531.1 Uncharacterized protein YoxC, contains an MCP-like domain [Halolactibacillus alkaliphilus]